MEFGIKRRKTNDSASQQPLMPARSILACSCMPMPLRIILRLPSLYAPEQVTNCDAIYQKTARNIHSSTLLARFTINFVQFLAFLLHRHSFAN